MEAHNLVLSVHVVAYRVHVNNIVRVLCRKALVSQLARPRVASLCYKCSEVIVVGL